MAVNQDYMTDAVVRRNDYKMQEVRIMKKFVLLLLCADLMLFGGCSGSDNNISTGETEKLEESTEMVETIANKMEEVNTVENAREIDDFSVENEMGLTLDYLLAYKGDVTNNQSDCALVFVALCKDGKVDAVQKELDAYRESMTSNLYIEFADKVEQAKNARIVTSGNYVIMVIAGISGVSYEDIDRTVTEVLNL